MVTQWLWGETGEVIETHGEWARVRGDWDGYEGWLVQNMIRPVYRKGHWGLVLGLNTFMTVRRSGQIGTQWISPGSEVPLFGDPLFEWPKNELTSITGAVGLPFQPLLPAFLSAAKQFLHVPYLWGGRSAAGLDCSGLVQISAKLCGICLPRDAWQQAQAGHEVSFDERQAGDLAFFQNDQGDISHVGILLHPNQIIHASTSVRIDRLVEQGIQNFETQLISHRIKGMIRLVEFEDSP
jgi:hypothetical protein